MTEAKSPSALFVTVLASITLIGPLSLHLFFPATPAVKADLGVDDGLAQLTVSVPMFVMAFLTLVYGTLSDRLGRRPVLLGGIMLFVAGAVISAFADGIWTLIAGRLIQAAGGASGLALARAIARDVFGTDRLVKVLAYLLMAYAVGPMVAPPIGGLLVDWSGWRSVLAFAAIAGALVGVLAWFVLYETHAGRGGGRRQSVFRDYRQLFGNARFTAFVIQSGCNSGAFFTAATASSFLMKDYLGRPASEYGLYFMFYPVGYWIGNFIATRLSGRVSIEAMVAVGSTLLVCTVAVQAAIVFGGVLTPLVIFVPGLLITLSQGLALPNAQAGAIGAAGATLAGTAAGIGVFVQMFGAGVFSQLYGLFADGTPMPMIVVTCSAALFALAAGLAPLVLHRR